MENLQYLYIDALVFFYLLCVTKRKNVWTNIVLYIYCPFKNFLARLTGWDATPNWWQRQFGRSG